MFVSAYLDLAGHSCTIERSAAQVVLCVHVRSSRQKQADDTDLSVPGAQVERGISEVVFKQDHLCHPPHTHLLRGCLLQYPGSCATIRQQPFHSSS